MNKKQLTTYGIRKKNIILRMLCRHKDKRQIVPKRDFNEGYSIYAIVCRDCGQMTDSFKMEF